MVDKHSEAHQQAPSPACNWALDDWTKKVMITPYLVSTDPFRQHIHHMDNETCKALKKHKKLLICPITKKTVIDLIPNYPLQRAIQELVLNPPTQPMPVMLSYFKPPKRVWNLSQWTGVELRDPCLVFRCGTWESVDYEELDGLGYLFLPNIPLKMAIQELNLRMSSSAACSSTSVLPDSHKIQM